MNKTATKCIELVTTIRCLVPRKYLDWEFDSLSISPLDAENAKIIKRLYSSIAPYINDFLSHI